ncbi:hypothetical protein HELRODRAFT_120372, partial [Helobdella robusta]|uniref:General transcription factor 3C polypeptide 3 n=1 Tax=Helobdella robusta TaxID=6412 RepID=T1EGP8_HELRO
RTRRPPQKLKRVLAGLMGEANMKYASGMFEEAVKISMEVICNAPNAPDPYHLLSMIYDDLGQLDKSLQHSLVAAQLSKGNVEEWLSVADKAIALNNLKLAVFCYERACKFDLSNEKLWKDKCELMERASCEKKKILDSYKHLIGLMRPSSIFIDLVRRTFNEYHTLGEDKKAAEVMRIALNNYPWLVTPSDINLLIDVYFLDKNYVDSLSLLEKHCGVNITRSNDSISEVVTNNLPVDLLAKLLICLIHLKECNVLEPNLTSLCSENCDEVGDLFLDVSEAFIAEKDYAHAERLLKLLLNSQNYNLAAVWLRFAECLKFLNKSDEAILAFSKVVEMASDHIEARMCLSNLYQQLGRYDEAIYVLQPISNCGDLSDCHLQLLLKKCNVLHQQNKILDFVDFAFKVLKMCAEQIFVQKCHTEVSNRVVCIRQLAYHHALNLIDKSCELKEIASLSQLSNEIWDLFMKLCEELCRLKLYEKLDKICTLMVICPVFLHDTVRSQELEFMCLISGLLSRNAYFAYSIIRHKLIKVLDDNNAWNIFGQVIAVSQDIRHNRFCIRFAMKHPNNVALCILNGHNALAAGSYKHSLGEYFACLKSDPKNPFYYMVIGITYVHLVSQKFSSHRHMLTVQACAFLFNYLKLRGECQESFYNIGRAMHQIGLQFLAVGFYERALKCRPAVDSPDFDLTREIAFNLYIIYMSTKSYQLASYILEKYLQI